MTLDEIILKLTNSYNCILLRDRSSGNDYDFFTSNIVSSVECFLRENGFIVTSRSSSHIEFNKYIEQELISIEIANTLFRDNRLNIALKREYEKLYIMDPCTNEIWFRTLKYLLSLKGSSKVYSFFETNRQDIISNNFYLDYLENNPFKKIDLNLMLATDNKYFFVRNLKIKFILKLIFKKIKGIINNFVSRKIFALIGADGAGKTYIISKLVEHDAYASLYFGGRDFMLDGFYNKLLNKGFVCVFLARLFQFFENIYRYLKAVFIATFKGKIVLFDRYPPIEYKINKNPKMVMLYNIFYKFFPKVKKIIFIYSDPITIYKRKQELSIDDIESWQNEILNSKFIVFRVNNYNGKIDEALNQCLETIYD